MKNIKLKKLVTASLLVALAVVGSTFSFPVFLVGVHLSSIL